MMQSSILGVWMLQSFYAENVETKEQTQTFGPEPRGTLIFHPDGRMAAIITPGRPTVPAGAAEKASAAQKLLAYSGRYRLEAPDRFVTTVDVAWMQEWVGTDQVRTYALDGDKLELIGAPGRMVRDDGTEATFVGVMRWTRESPSPTEGKDRTSP